MRRFVEACRHTRTILPATTTIERICADALVDAERRIEARPHRRAGSARASARPRVSVSAAAVLVAANVVVVAVHQGFLVGVAHRREAAIEVTREGGAVIAHVSAAELFNPVWGGPPVVVLGSVESLRRAVADFACAPGGAVGFAQGASAVELAAAPSAVTTADGLSLGGDSLGPFHVSGRPDDGAGARLEVVWARLHPRGPYEGNRGILMAFIAFRPGAAAAG